MKPILRSLAVKPGYAFLLVLIWAVCLGANTAMFSLVYSVLLRPLPFPESERLVAVQTELGKLRGRANMVSRADLEDLARESRLVESGGFAQPQRFNLIGEPGAMPVDYARVSYGFLETLGVKPQLGRTFLPSEDQAGGDVRKVILGHGLWQSRYGGNPGILGQAIRTAAGSFTVIGVMPAGFVYPGKAQMWIPEEHFLQTRQEKRTSDRGWRPYLGVLRLKPGVTREQAQAEASALGRELERRYPLTNEKAMPVLRTLREVEVGDLRPYLWLLFASAGLMLLIGAVNATNLMLVRAARRRREYSIQSALGADTSRLIGTQVKEGLVLAVAGSALGLGLASAMLAAIPRLAALDLPTWVRLDLSWEAAVFGAVVAIGVGTVASLLPAWQASRVDLNEVLKEGARGSSAGKARLKQGLVAAEVALSVALLVAAGLLVESLDRMRRVDLGFDARGLVTTQISIYVPGTEQYRREQSTVMVRRVVERLRQLPGVEMVGGTDTFPFSPLVSSRANRQMEAKGEAAEDRVVRAPVKLVDVTPEYFDVMKIPLREGRAFRETDDTKAPWVIILSERAAKELFPGRSAVGREVRLNSQGYADPWARVVGVVGNVKFDATDGANALEFYYPYQQYGQSTTRLALRVRGNAAALEPAIRQAVVEADPNLAVDDVRMMSDLVEGSMWRQRLWAAVVGAFALTALMLAALGLYGTLAYTVGQRTREIGIRMAIGAEPGRVVREIAGEGLMLMLSGAVVGLVGGAVAARGLESLLFGVQWSEPAIYLRVTAALVAAGLLASWLPARRASRVDPIVALRQE